MVSLGDSFAWGVGIEHDDTYARRVERALGRRPGERWEVVQLARPGMGTVEQAEQLAEEGFAYGPDVVVLGFVLNDSEDENAAEARRARDWEEMRRERQERRSGGRLLDRSALWRFVAGRLEATGQNRRRLAAYRSQFLPGYPGWAACRAALARMGALCRERKVPFVVMIFPLFADPLDERYPFADIHAQVAQAAREAGAVVIDLLPAYRGLRSSAAGGGRGQRRAPERDRPPHRRPGAPADARPAAPAHAPRLRTRSHLLAPGSASCTSW